MSVSARIIRRERFAVATKRVVFAAVLGLAVWAVTL